jgi:uncharacterized protein
MLNKMYVVRKALICLFIFAALVASAQIPKPLKDTYVNDFAGVLTKDQVTSLNKKIFITEKQAAVQLAIVLVNKIPVGYDIQDFAVLIGKKWHVGKNQKGIVYVAAIDQHKQRIEVARNLDATLNGQICMDILNAMKPLFKNKNYKGGLDILVDQINSKLQIIAQPAASPSPASSPAATAVQAPQKQADGNDTLIGGAVVFGIIVLLYIWYRKQKRKRIAMQNFYNNTPGPGAFNLNNPNLNYGNPGYGNQGYGYPNNMNQPDHTLRNVAAGAVLGAAAGYAARTIQDHMSQPNNPSIPGNDNPGNITSGNNDAGDDRPANWGNWGNTDGGSTSSDDSSSYDSGFSDDSSSDSSDSDSTNNGATSDW